MRTVDVRLLVRSSLPLHDLLAQLLNGALRVHAVAQLVPDPRVALRDGTINPRRGLPVPVPPVHRHRHSEAHFVVVRAWTGDELPVVGPDEPEEVR